MTPSTRRAARRAFNSSIRSASSAGCSIIVPITERNSRANPAVCRSSNAAARRVATTASTARGSLSGNGTVSSMCARATDVDSPVTGCTARISRSSRAPPHRDGSHRSCFPPCVAGNACYATPRNSTRSSLTGPFVTSRNIRRHTERDAAEPGHVACLVTLDPPWLGWWGVRARGGPDAPRSAGAPFRKPRRPTPGPPRCTEPETPRWRVACVPGSVNHCPVRIRNRKAARCRCP
jgi:hypothetical protein